MHAGLGLGYRHMTNHEIEEMYAIALGGQP
jgi:hypothetical protein